MWTLERILGSLGREAPLIHFDWRNLGHVVKHKPVIVALGYRIPLMLQAFHRVWERSLCSAALLEPKWSPT